MAFSTLVSKSPQAVLFKPQRSQVIVINFDGNAPAQRQQAVKHWLLVRRLTGRPCSCAPMVEGEINMHFL
jgi:hypothetical protein